MFVKIPSSAGRQYVKVVEAFGDDRGVPCQRVIATLGRLQAVWAGDSNALIDGLLRAAGRPKVKAQDLAFAPALSMGDTRHSLRGLVHPLLCRLPLLPPPQALS